jgi:drug/metabolite transporter (DMT)-like permease
MMHTNTGELSAPGPSAGMTRPGVWLTDATLLLMAAIWGVNFVVVKFATGVLPPMAFNAVRVGGAAVALVLIAFIGDSPWPRWRDMFILVALGVLGNGLYQLFFIEGVALTRATDAALLIAATPAFIAVIGRMHGVERIGAKGWFGILLSVAGIGLISSAAAMTGQKGSLIGDVLILAGSLCWAIYTVLLKPYTDAIEGVKLSALTMVGGAISLMIFAWPTVLGTRWSAAPPAAWGALAYSGIGALVIAYLFWYRGVRVIGPTKTAMYSNLQPVFAVAVAWMVLGELPTIWQGVGAASIMSGLLLTRS